MRQLFEFFERKFNCEVISKTDIENILMNYDNLNISIWHADTFLKDETEETHDEIIKLLEKF